MPPALAPIFNNVQPQGTPRRPGNAGSPGPGLFGPVQNDQPVATPPQPVTPAAQPAANPFGAVSTPGMIAPAPQQPGQAPPGVVVVQQPRRD
jgi:hypothetical protein